MLDISEFVVFSNSRETANANQDGFAALYQHVITVKKNIFFNVATFQEKAKTFLTLSVSYCNDNLLEVILKHLFW